MKSLNLSAVSTSVAFPVKSGTFDHLQSAYKEALAEIAKALVGVSSYNSSTVYVLEGIVNSGTFPVVTTTAGGVFYNGEIYLVDAASFTCTGSDVAVLQIVTSYFSAANADPVQFTDGISRNVHEIKKVQVTNGLSGSGISDLDNVVYISLVQTNEVLTKTNTTAFSPSGDYQPATKKYVDDLQPAIKPVLNGTITVGDVASGGTTKTVSLGTTLASANYKVVGSIISLGTADDDTTVFWSVRNRTTTSFDIFFREITSLTQNINFDWILFQ